MSRIARVLTSRVSSSGWFALLPPADASCVSISPIAAAYGRAARMSSSARRILAPATIFMARVICWVFLSDLTRSRSWRSVGI